MRIPKFHFVLFLALSSVAFAQDVKVNKITQITDLSQGEYYYPKFSTDNSKIFFSSATYAGIWYYDVNTKQVNNITKEDAAGYDFTTSPDGKEVIYRTYKMADMKRIFSVVSQNIDTKETKVLVADRKDLYPPKFTTDNKLSFAVNSKLESINYKENAAQLQKVSEKPVVIIDNQKIVLFVNGETKTLAPLGEGNYIWPSVSPDNQKLLFTFAGHGTYVSDLNGNIITEIGVANAPQWSPDGKWIVYMVDKDNGQKVTDSEIFIVSADGTKKINITNSKDVYEMYPAWSPDGKRVAFNSEDGKIFIVDLNID